MYTTRAKGGGENDESVWNSDPPFSLQFDPVTIYVSSGVNPKRARRRTEEEEEEEEEEEGRHGAGAVARRTCRTGRKLMGSRSSKSGRTRCAAIHTEVRKWRERERERERNGEELETRERREWRRERESVGGKGQDVCGKHIFVYVCACVDR